jgi:hypothetical protein
MLTFWYYVLWNCEDGSSMLLRNFGINTKLQGITTQQTTIVNNRRRGNLVTNFSALLLVQSVPNGQEVSSVRDVMSARLNSWSLQVTNNGQSYSPALCSRFFLRP